MSNAQYPPRNRKTGRVTSAAIAMLGLLLVLPVCALVRLAGTIDWRLLTARPILMSLATYLAYRSDKRRAQAGTWRISESTLHLAELAGGWPGAFLAQRQFRHKISKTPYQVGFWIIVLIYQCVAFDSVIGWRIARRLARLF